MAMDFQEAIDASTGKERDELIRDEIYNADLPCEECMDHGGWPEDVSVTGITIAENDKGDLLLIRVDVSGTESAPSGCKDINSTYSFTETLEFQVDRKDGVVLSEEIANWDGKDVRDTYPGDFY